MLKRVLENALNAAIAVVRAALVVSLISLPILASQNNLFNPTSGTLSGLTMVQGFNNALDSVNTCNSGASAPSNQLSGTPSAGNCWYNTSTGAVQWFDGTDWLPVGYIDASNHVFTPILGGGSVSASVASASTANLCGSSGAAPTQSYLTITGTTTITGFGSNCQVGQLIVVKFSGILTLTYNATTLILPTSANITTAAGDFAVMQYLGSGNWQALIYQRATGAALSTTGLNVGSSALAASATGFSAPINGSLLASVGSNQLTVSLVGINGSNASSSNPILIQFRSQTGNNTTSAVVTGSLQASLSMTLGTTDSMGCTTAVLCRLWVTAICQTESSNICTSILLGLSNQSVSTQVFPLNEALLQSTGSGTAGGTSAGVIQTSVASLSSKAVRIIGYVEVTWTSGTGWATTPSYTQMFGPGIKKPGDIVQSNSVSGSTLTFTPTSGINPVQAFASLYMNLAVTTTGGATVTVALELNSSIVSSAVDFDTGSTSQIFQQPFSLVGMKAAGTTSSISWTLVVSASSNFGTAGISTPFILMNEIMGANDNVEGVPALPLAA